MKLTVIIPTLGRREQVARLLSYLNGQTRLPDEVILSAPDATHIELPECCSFPVSLVFGPKGLAAQRNTALAGALARFDIITFFDDDFLPSAEYLEQVEKAFVENNGWAVVMGMVVRDGATNAGLTWEDAEAALRETKSEEHDGPSVVDHVGAYGCNMSFRSSFVGDLRFDVITFFDDDFVPSAEYLEHVEKAFLENDGWAVVMGRVIRDGAANAGLTWEDAEAALRETDGQKFDGPLVVDHVGAYGCNMSFRSSLVGDLRFDERLVLYGWQEDIDFTSQMRSKGRVVCVTAIKGVHLGIKTGRVSGKRFGYSQVANAIYLIKKGSVPASFALPLMFRNIAANLAKSLRPEPYIDRRGRLRGNMLAILHIAIGRIEPEYILKI